MNSLYHSIKNQESKMAVIGLGYVGLPLAVEFAKKTKTIGFDINEDKIRTYLDGIDPTNEVGDHEIQHTSLHFTSDERELAEAAFFIVAVPTPSYSDNIPNLEPLKKANEILGRNIKKGSVIVYESTVYPGVTEEICVPVLEKTSGMKCGVDFKIGYSPERINPGDKAHRLSSITKIVAGMDEETAELIANIYELVVDQGIYRAESIKVAEAAKVIENTQRDINIAFMNELAILFNRMGIDTNAVLKAAATKWNFLDFKPGLVGGHCIGVDPYYLTYKAQQVGYMPNVILAGRKINDRMGFFVVETLIKMMIHANIKIKGAKVAVLGIAFKENCPDVRNTQVIKIIEALKDYGVEIIVADPVADEEETKRSYGISLSELSRIEGADAVILAVSHDSLVKIEPKQFDRMYTGNTTGNKIIFDVKSALQQEKFLDAGYIYRRL